jgi:hypothetical protein
VGGAAGAAFLRHSAPPGDNNNNNPSSEAGVRTSVSGRVSGGGGVESVTKAPSFLWGSHSGALSAGGAPPPLSHALLTHLVLAGNTAVGDTGIELLVDGLLRVSLIMALSEQTYDSYDYM